MGMYGIVKYIIMFQRMVRSVFEGVEYVIKGAPHYKRLRRKADITFVPGKCKCCGHCLPIDDMIMVDGERYHRDPGTCVSLFARSLARYLVFYKDIGDNVQETVADLLLNSVVDTLMQQTTLDHHSEEYSKEKK